MNPESYKSKLFTSFTIPDNVYLGTTSRLLFCGSCFSENIGEKLKRFQFDVCINPFGILYDPLSIARFAERLASGIPYSESDLYFHAGMYHALDHHGSFSGKNAAVLIQDLNRRVDEARNFLGHADVAVLTPGTAYVYYHEDTQKYVANCHKLPNRNFSKTLLTEKNILEAWQLAVAKLRSLKPGLRIMFTVSPVKHLRDGISENAVSKARLLSAIHQFIDSYKDPLLDYFPAFEIMNEELRDHRFYESDLAHPNAWSVEYIFQKFLNSRFDTRSRNFFEKAARYLKMLDHRPMTSDVDELKLWELKKTEFRAELIREFPEIPFNSPED